MFNHIHNHRVDIYIYMFACINTFANIPGIWLPNNQVSQRFISQAWCLTILAIPHEREVSPIDSYLLLWKIENAMNRNTYRKKAMTPWKKVVSAKVRKQNDIVCM